MDGAVGAHAERGAQRLRDALRTDRCDDHLGVGGAVLHAQRLFEGVGVVAVDLELDVLLLDPRAVRADVEARVLVGDLLQADEDLHARATSGSMKMGLPGAQAPARGG